MCKNTIIITRPKDGLSILIDDDQGFNHSDFLKEIVSLGLQKSVRVFESFGPAEIIDDYYTSKGKFSISISFDEDPGILIYSDDHGLIDEIYRLMIFSGIYCEGRHDD